MTFSDFLSTLPTIASLIVIEGLLSVDNALAIAALASHLPKRQQQLALRLGIIGAYLFRGIALFFVAIIIANPWLKIIGSAYLIYLMASNLSRSSCGHEAETSNDEDGVPKNRPGLIATIAKIELMDLSLSLDNVVAAVAIDKRFWVVCLGVFIGILTLRLLAGYCIKLVEKFPVLEKTAFLLIGFVGVLLLTEITLELNHIHFHIGAGQKFIGIAIIIAATLLYQSNRIAKSILDPVIAVGRPIIVFLDRLTSLAFWPITKSLELARAALRRE
jgi:YkoY family integral membrane protein